MIDKVEIFTYLDNLRDSGVTNMFGAGAYLQEEFGLDRREAGRLVAAWMQTFDPDKPVTERATAA